MGLQEIIQQQQQQSTYEQLPRDQVCKCTPVGCHPILPDALAMPTKALTV